jgi:hypothetical protein
MTTDRFVRGGKATQKWGPDSPNTLKLLQMRRDGLQMREIAAHFGVSHQRIDQILHTMANVYGMDVDTTDCLPYWKGRDVAAIIGCDSLTLNKHVFEAKLIEGVDYFYNNPTAQHKRYTYAGVAKLDRHTMHKCRVCEKEFRCHKRRTWVCNNPECRKLANYGHQIQENLRGPGLLIQKACAAVEADDYMGIAAASKHTVLSVMQINWLIYNNAIPVKPHPTQTWRQHPVQMVSVTHLKIAEQIYREHGRIK